MDGRTIGIEYGVLDPVGCYIRETEEMLLRGESVGAEKYRLGIWRTQGSRKLAGSEYFPSIREVQTCEPPVPLRPLKERVAELRRVNEWTPPTLVVPRNLWVPARRVQHRSMQTAPLPGTQHVGAPQPAGAQTQGRSLVQAVRDAIRAVFG